MKNDAASPSLSQQLCHSFGTVAFMKQWIKLCLLWDAGSGLHEASVTVEKKETPSLTDMFPALSAFLMKHFARFELLFQEEIFKQCSSLHNCFI